MRTFVSLNPFADMRRMTEMMDRMMSTEGNGTRNAGQVSVPMDIWEEDGAMFVKASLPGVKPEDVNLSIDDDVLTISGEFKDDHAQHPDRRVFHREHASGSFVRSVRLPEDVDQNAIDAEYDNGYLTVRIPRSAKPQHQPKQLRVRNKNAPSLEGGDYAYADKNKHSEQRGRATESKKQSSEAKV